MLWEDFWAATRRVELTEDITAHAGHLASRHALRGADAVHLASLLAVGGEERLSCGKTSVIQFFGSYMGTVQRPGFWWVLSLTRRHGVSIRVRNFETGHLKVNDAGGSPVVNAGSLYT